MVNPGHIVPAFMGAVTKNYMNFDGRVNRYDFWHFVLAYTILSVIVNILVTVLVSISGIFSLLSTVFSLGLLLPYLGLGVRRMHDVGKAWWFVLIPLFNLYLMIQPGDEGANEYGEAPAGGANL